MILLDLSIAQPPETGVQLVTRLGGEALAAARPQSLAYLAPDGGAIAGDAGQRRVPSACRKPANRILWQQFVLPRIIRREGASCLFAPGGTMPLTHPCPTVLLVHDLIAIKQPHLCRRFNRLHMQSLGLASIRKADHLITATRAVADDVMRIAGRRSSDLTVLPFPVDPLVAETPPTTNRDRSRLVFVGTIEPRKGIGDLLRAFRLLADKAPELELHLVGRYRPAKMIRSLKAWTGPGRVLLRGYLPRQQLIAEMAGAGCCVLLSRAEGFGLPALEAMALGTPFVCSDQPAIREVAGNFAYFCDADDPVAVARTIREALDAPDERLISARRDALGRTWPEWGQEAARICDASAIGN